MFDFREFYSEQKCKRVPEPLIDLRFKIRRPPIIAQSTDSKELRPVTEPVVFLHRVTYQVLINLQKELGQELTFYSNIKPKKLGF